MSIAVMTAVWERSKQKGGSLLLLLALADHANDDGQCWPGLERLAKKSRMSVRQVQRCIERLQEAGEIAVQSQAGPHAANLYTVLVAGDKMSRVGVRQAGRKSHPRGDISSPGMSPESSGTVNESSGTVREQEERPNGRSRPRDSLFDAIAETCQVDPATAGPSIGKVRSALLKATPPYTAAEVNLFRQWWWAGGKRQRPPRVWDLQEQIGVVRTETPRPEPKGFAAVRQAAAELGEKR